MRIGIDAHHLNGKPQGSRTYLLQLIRALDEIVGDDDELHLFSFAPDATRQLVEGIHHRIFPQTAKLRLPFVVPVLELVHGLDVFHSQYIAPPFSFVPEVVTIHDVLFETHPELFAGAFSSRSTSLIRRSAKRAHTVLTVSEFSRQAILEAYGIPDERVVVTYNAVDPDRFYPMETPPEELRKRFELDRPFVLSVGRLEPRKNLERLIAGFMRARAQLGGNVTLALVGVSDFRYQSIVEKVASLPEGAVKLVGPVSDDDLPGLYNLAEALAYPSLAEGFGMPVLESMACRTPVLTTRRGALPEVGQEAVLYVDPESEDAIADGLVQILGDTGLRAALCEAGIARARELTWEETARGTLAAYRRAL